MGSGNFLTETYLSLRRLENEALSIIYNNSVFLDAADTIKVSIGQFYGIEVNDFAVKVAKTALWIAEAQMWSETQTIAYSGNDISSFLPLESYENIVEVNALRIDWNDVLESRKCSYIMGNPPFLGARLMDKYQKEDMKLVFGKLKGVGNLDYVSAWYKKACSYIGDSKINVSFVSTNSITQGEQVAILWQDLMQKYNITINFAYRTFKWDSEASDKAAVHCVIVGFSKFNYGNNHLFLSENQSKKVANINPYLLEAPSVFVSSRRKPIKNVSEMVFGSMANDDGNLILSEDEKTDMVSKYPDSSKYIKPFIGAKEYINNINRYCLWIESNDLKDIQKNKLILERLKKVKEKRELSSRRETRALADYPYAFGEIRQPKTGNYIVVPRVSSENRRYIPMGFKSCETIASDALLIVPNGTLSLFAILSSNVHMAWMRAVAGRLEMRYRYSASIVYNNFPFIDITENNLKTILEKTAKGILDARKLYPESSLADLYNELTMPPELRKAHQQNDRAVMFAYGFKGISESECVAELMKLYEELTK